MANKPLCCVINYDTADGTNWKAGILAYSVADAVEYIKKRVKTIKRINGTEAGRPIDAIDDKIMKDFFTEEVVEEVEIEVPVEVIKEVYVESEDAEPKCPWCKKTFKTEQTLKTHCIKYHLKDE